MRVLQLDVEHVHYELLEPESGVFEASDKAAVKLDDALLVLISVEAFDTKDIAKEAVEDIKRSSEKLKRKKIVIYPFAHLSANLAEPKAALEIINIVHSNLSGGELDVVKAPFGWNKKLGFEIKGHPLAEQGRSYGNKSNITQVANRAPKIDISIVKKSDFSGLPETDHRTISEKLNLFSMQEVSPGMVYWHKNGLILYRGLVSFMREKLYKYDYEEISTPSLANLALWHVSGHIDHYKDNMFTLITESEQLGMKPMNCPSTILIYKSKKWSYRDLPFRTAIFDKLYRNEISGALTGLFRVRELTQDDGHIFIREDQLEAEMKTLLEMVNEVYKTFGMQFNAKLSTMPDDHMGDEALWEKATLALKNSLESNGIDYTINEKDGAFYGPKIDFDVTDSLGRKWQCATIQVDYQLPLRFKLEYIGEDGQAHTPIIVHRAILGSLERFIGVLIEHYQGKFPLWLSPVQVRIVSISESANSYASGVFNVIKDAGVRTQLDISDKTLDYKIRDAQMQKIPYIVIVGKKEQEAKTLAIRDRSGKQKFNVTLNEFIEKVSKESAQRTADAVV